MYYVQTPSKLVVLLSIVKTNWENTGIKWMFGNSDYLPVVVFVHCWS